MPAKKQSNVVPPLTNWGGTRSIQRRLERSNTLIQNREAVSYALLCMANTKITDIMTWDEDKMAEMHNDRQNRLSQERTQLIDLAQDVLQHPENVGLIEPLIRPALEEVESDRQQKGLM